MHNHAYPIIHFIAFHKQVELHMLCYGIKSHISWNQIPISGITI